MAAACTGCAAEDGDLDEGQAEVGESQVGLVGCPFDAAHPMSLGQAQNYNLFALGDVDSVPDVTGRLAAAGNIQLDSFSVGQAVSGNPVLVSGGNLTLAHGTVYGQARHGGTLSATAVNFTGGTLAGNPINFAQERDSLLALSDTLAAFANNGTTVVRPWGAIELTGTDAALDVFSLPAAALAATTSLSISVPAGAVAIVNVQGTTAAMGNLGIALSGVDAGSLLFNFNAATSLTIQGVGVFGSVLAPRAAAHTDNGQINGTFVAGSVSGSAEYHHLPFTGSVTSCTGSGPTEPPPPPPPPPTPACTVDYDVTSLLGLAFSAAVVVHWTGPTLHGWTASYQFVNLLTLTTTMQNATFRQFGRNVTVTNVAANADVANGQAVTFRFQAVQGFSSTLHNFVFNGVHCSVTVL